MFFFLVYKAVFFFFFFFQAEDGIRDWSVTGVQTCALPICLSQLDSQPQILAYAFLFGIAQQLVTRLVDQQVQDILTKVPSKEPVSTKPQPSPSEGPIPPGIAPIGTPTTGPRLTMSA